MERNEIRQHLFEAYVYARDHSQDPNTKNGAKLVDEKTNRSVAWGTNRFPRGVVVTPERLTRPAKYQHIVHAENDSIFDAAIHGEKTNGLTMIGTWVACNECAKAIIQAGIKRVIGHQATLDSSPDRWKEPIRIAAKMFEEAGIILEYWKGEIGGVELLFDGHPFRP